MEKKNIQMTKLLSLVSKIIVTCLILVTLFFCSSYRLELYHGVSKESAIKNAIIDYSRFDSSKGRYNVFRIGDESTFNYFESNNYGVLIKPMINNYTLTSNDTIGSKSMVLYNDFIIQNEKLFLWVNPKKRTNQATIDIMHKFKVLDSSLVKNGFTDSEFSTIGTPRETKFYIFCKNDTRIYKSVRGGYISKTNYPKLDCGSNRSN